MRSAFVFPGQGSQYTGMGHDLYESYSAAREVFDAADRVLGFGLSELCFGHDKEAIKSTDVTQPAIFAHSLATLRVLQSKGQWPDMVAGHSLGELTALCGADALDFEAGLKLVRFRGLAMARAGTKRPGAMAAVLGLDESGVQGLCEEASDDDAEVVAANYNAPGQIVVSGDRNAVQRLMQIARSRQVRRVVPLAVSGAFHSPLMEPARQEFAAELATLRLGRPKWPVYLNVTAAPSQSPGEILDAMLGQLISPVRWSQTLLQMYEDGAGRFVEVGPGRVLIGLVRRTLGRAVVSQSVGVSDDVAAISEG